MLNSFSLGNWKLQRHRAEQVLLVPSSSTAPVRACIEIPRCFEPPSPKEKVHIVGIASSQSRATLVLCVQRK